MMIGKKKKIDRVYLRVFRRDFSKKNIYIYVWRVTAVYFIYLFIYLRLNFLFICHLTLLYFLFLSLQFSLLQHHSWPLVNFLI
jgi:hypothetical protein